ncbi:hypothetical protein BJ508DRAFT_35697 [Ascobolus immersus RN42]|uniref:Uncharacterized protein n=1 Tax=Ascobolus immersus RN42 TaxID=1160509 RepID=A0A3N4HXF3_ASCIM|nr:hypothetical protein BJ508DRAFT_35697 [Ascobolus immersus RN42]
MRSVKLRHIDDKISALDLVSAALEKLQLSLPADSAEEVEPERLFEELQELDKVLDRASALLSKRLGNEVGQDGVRQWLRDGETEATALESGTYNTPAASTKSSSGGGGKAYLSSWRKLRREKSSAQLTTPAAPPPTSAGPQTPPPGTPSFSPATSSLSLAPNSVQIPGPLGQYASALTRLFELAQIMLRLPLEKVRGEGVEARVRVGVEFSVNNARDFFAFWVGRMVVGDLEGLLGVWVGRGGGGVGG